MSASTITTRVEPGEALAREIAERRGALAVERDHLVRQRTPALRQSLVERGKSVEVEALAGLYARCEAIEQVAPAEALDAALATIRAAEDGGPLAAAGAEVEQAERLAEQAWTELATQEATLDSVVRDLPPELQPVSAPTRRRDGALQVTLQRDGGGHLPLVAPRTRDGAQRLEWGVGQAGISLLRTADGSVLGGCEARERLVDDACSHINEQRVVEIRREGAAATPRRKRRARAGEQMRHAER